MIINVKNVAVEITLVSAASDISAYSLSLVDIETGKSMIDDVVLDFFGTVFLSKAEADAHEYAFGPRMVLDAEALSWCTGRIEILGLRLLRDFYQTIQTRMGCGELVAVYA